MRWTFRQIRFVLILMVLMGLGACQSQRGNTLVPPTAELSKPSTPRWGEVIQAMEQSDRDSLPKPGEIILVGSSSIVRWDLNHHLQNRPVHNRGFGGSHMADAATYIDTLVIQHRPSLVFVYEGDNDIVAGKTPTQVRDDAHRLAYRVLEALPQTTLVFMAAKPCPARWSYKDQYVASNQLIAALCDQDDRLNYLDTWTPMLNDAGQPKAAFYVSDGIHLSPKGYRVWDQLVEDKIAERTPSLSPQGNR